MTIIEVWLNCPDKKTAKTISDALKSRHLIATAKVYPLFKNIIPIDGEDRIEKHIPLAVQSREELLKKIKKSIQQQFPKIDFATNVIVLDDLSANEIEQILIATKKAR